MNTGKMRFSMIPPTDGVYLFYFILLLLLHAVACCIKSEGERRPRKKTGKMLRSHKSQVEKFKLTNRKKMIDAF